MGALLDRFSGDENKGRLLEAVCGQEQARLIITPRWGLAVSGRCYYRHCIPTGWRRGENAE